MTDWRRSGLLALVMAAVLLLGWLAVPYLATR